MAYGSNALNLSQRDIVIVPFPFSDLSTTKVRPALVISNHAYHAAHRDAVVLALTSNLSISDYRIVLETEDLESGRLPVKSAVRVDKPFSISQGKILKTLAKITPEKFEEVKTVLDKLIQ
jgi:mRNA interferase MazF